jgi:hypothetical protein
MGRGIPVFALAFGLALASGCGGYHLPKTEGVSGAAQVDNGVVLGAMRLRPAVCQGLDLKPEYYPLDERSVEDFLKQRGFPTRIVRARSDLVYVELQLNPNRDEWVRLRVAILPTAPQAGQELHRAMLEHGTGSWGVHRSNLAVLAPIGDTDDILAFAAKTKLACWGVLTIAGEDDAFVVPGGYREL